MNTSVVLIPESHRHWYDGAKSIETVVYDIDEVWPGVWVGTVKKTNAPIFGTVTFAVRKDEQNQWYISA